MRQQLKIPDELCCTHLVRWVASQYMPNILPENASKWIRREIARNDELAETLDQLGWSTKQRHFNPRQLQAVVDHLGPFW